MELNLPFLKREEKGESEEEKRKDRDNNKKEEEKKKKLTEAKTVGEMAAILQEIPVEDEEVKEEEKREEKAGIEIDPKQLFIEIEKMKVEIDGIKEDKTRIEEKIDRFVESIGELRSLLSQREVSFKEQEIKLNKLVEIVGEIDPTKYGVELKKIEKDVSILQARIEKLERISVDLVKDLQSLRDILDKVKDISTIMGMNRELSEKLAKIEDIGSKVERDTNKVEKMYAEIDKKIMDIPMLKEKNEKLDGLLKELLMSVDEIKIRLDACISKDDLDSLRESMREETRVQVEDLRKEIEEMKISKPVEEKIEEIKKFPSESEIEELKREREEIIRFLSALEDEYREATISEKSYQEAKEKNTVRLHQIEKRLKEIKEMEEQMEIEKQIFTAKKAIDEINRVSEELNKKLTDIEKKLTSVDLLVSDIQNIKNKLTQLEESDKKIISDSTALSNQFNQIKSIFEKRLKEMSKIVEEL
ncbi:MAG: hypothetical protein OH319_04930 [Candidatus Parvarchaeota archaeon]|nr:hypothetical protein [Candidatus Jingweiarchaeum tengchongense]MCW1297680.1 hypothetical protein [Candidatus Jingweiarchaeum tengchongense]MCW1299691.1 hypothetical protein [Candidatus Jingweiarchaeum tengchongense]MCW1304341.1 hypothetical protein [Candidatus Jingweiarchaeum tengchongense]MCW1305676.1 hypothetical protein [Candidatus Jingweiarchaeum tengchongense]